MQKAVDFLKNTNISDETIRSLFAKVLPLSQDEKVGISLEEAELAELITENFEYGLFKVTKNYGEGDYEAGDFAEPVFIGAPIISYEVQVRYSEKLNSMYQEVEEFLYPLNSIVRKYIEKNPSTEWKCSFPGCRSMVSKIDSVQKLSVLLQKLADGESKGCRDRSHKNTFSISEKLDFIPSIKT